MKKTLIAFLGFFTALIIFMPKKNLFYTLTHYLPNDVKLSFKANQTPVSLNLENFKIYYANVPSFETKKIEILPWILYNRADLSEIFIPALNLKIKNAKIAYSPILFNKIFVKSANFHGTIDPFERKIHIVFSNPPSQIKPFLKKTKEGFILNEKF